jgi:hypothetical protein
VQPCLPRFGPQRGLFLIRKPQRSPRHVPRNVALPIGRFEVGRLHERVDVGNLKHTLLLDNSHTVATLWRDHAGSGIHFGPPVNGSFANCLPPGKGITGILTLLGTE